MTNMINMTATNSVPRSSRRFARIASPLAALLVTLVPLAAQAQRKSPLEDAPAIRKRVELRETRFEAGAGFGSTLNQDFYHTMMVDLKLGFHFNDWLSLSAMGAFGVANLSTGFRDHVIETLPMAMPTVPREPTQATASASMTKINSVLAAQLEFTPFTGKYSLFGKIFAHYDFYLFGGVGALNVAPSDSALAACSSGGMTTSCGVSGLKPGGNAGVGLHTFFNNWFALGVELRDIIAQINPAGRDVNGDGFANSNDLTWGSTYVVTANLTVYLPSLAAISP
jgi:outer membrane beta-barrel protein